MVMMCAPGDPIAGVDPDNRAEYVRAVGIDVPAAGVAGVLPGDTVPVPADLAEQLAAQGWTAPTPDRRRGAKTPEGDA